MKIMNLSKDLRYLWISIIIIIIIIINLLTAAQFFRAYTDPAENLHFQLPFFILELSLLNCTANISFIKYII
jgi:hypothetical protein